jgi:hypothetical protein
MTAKHIETVRKAYNIIENSRKRYGTLKKCEFHLHTPASYDYKFFDYEKKRFILFKDLSTLEIIKIANQEGYLSNEKMSFLLEHIEEYNDESYKRVIQEKSLPFENFKEYLAFSIVAHRLYEENIDVVMLADHNTVSGYHKLNVALDIYYKERFKFRDTSRLPIVLFLGVEISCSENNHVAAILDAKKFNELDSYLRDITLNEKDGTYNTSHHVINDITEMGGIAYLAHMNTSKYFGSSGYNKALFLSSNLNIIGITNLQAKEATKKRISEISQGVSKREFCFVHEGDSHAPTMIGAKNTWIKLDAISFDSLKRAFKNYKISIYLEKPNTSDKFIKGTVIEPGNNGFLTSKNQKDKYFMVDFSRDLNCIIGGRGTGKSTLLSIVETVLTLEMDDIEKLKFISQHKKIYLVFHCEGDDYVLEFIPQTNDKSSSLRGFFLPKAFSGMTRLSPAWIRLFKVSGDNFEHIQKFSEAQKIIRKIYKRSYSINDIINKIERGEIGHFIRNIVLYGVQYKEPAHFIEQMEKKSTAHFNKFIRENISSFEQMVHKAKDIVQEKIYGFNLKQKDIIQIHSSPKEKDLTYYLEPLMEKVRGKGHVNNTYLTWNDVESYVYKISKKIGYLKFVELLLNKRYKELEEQISISSLANPASLTFKEAEKNLQEITKSNLSEVYKIIAKRMLFFRKEFEHSIKKWYEVIDDFTLLFNINSKENIGHHKAIMKNIEELSLGQKVAAILTFVFQFGYHTNDNTPLIIDQPEDNLDNQYIYKNLVKSLREIKNNRQVIIVTHSSTIVTNADAEQVIVMGSDNEKAWVEKKGYPSDRKIVNHILNYLEGGIDSFKHKMETYALFIKELN